MQLTHVTFTGPPLDDEELMTRLPDGLAGLLRQINGFIQFHGGLHVRGACQTPAWHSLRDAWEGQSAFHHLYWDVQPEDVPFAEDCMGDQFLLREGRVHKLAAETGEIESLGLSFGEFFDVVAADSVEFSLNPLLQLQENGGNLEPGQLLAAYPPFCLEESADGVTLAAISAHERRRFLAGLAAQIRDVPDGGKIEFRIVD